MIKKYLIITCLMLFSGFAGAQTDVKIMDLLVLPFPDFTKPKSDSLVLEVNFKINNPSNASKIQFLMGTAPNQSDVLLATAGVFTNGNVSVINYNNVNSVIRGYMAGFKVKVSKQQYNNCKTVTLYAETKEGKETPHLFFKK